MCLAFFSKYGRTTAKEILAQIPTLTEITSALAADMPISPRIAIDVNSRTPQPLIEIGILAANTIIVIAAMSAKSSVLGATSRVIIMKAINVKNWLAHENPIIFINSQIFLKENKVQKVRPERFF